MSYFYFLSLAVALGTCIYLASRNRSYQHKSWHPSSNNTAKDFVDDSEICTICREEIDPRANDIRYLTCGHSFHEFCVAEWLKRKNSCPNCNFDQQI